MSRMESIFYRLTGVAGRHNRSLSEVKDWAGTVEKFLRTYGLWRNNAGLDGLLKRSGDAKFDLTGIDHNGRDMVVRAREIMDRSIEPLVAKTVESVAVIRKCLISPSLRNEKLPEAVAELRASFKKLNGALKKIIDI
jgi:hypothetical protein